MSADRPGPSTRRRVKDLGCEFTHEPIELGENGPIHQTIESLASLRAIPNLTVLRSADANETADVIMSAIAGGGPVAQVLAHQGLPDPRCPRV